jgi:hypothetical protein
MTLSDVRDWLKRFAVNTEELQVDGEIYCVATGTGDSEPFLLLALVEHYYIGKLDRKQNRSIGVYSRATTGEQPVTALGGLQCTGTAVKQISILIHWNNNARETDAAAQELFNMLLAAENIQIGGHQVDYLRLMVPEPVDVGTDENGVYERVIWMDIYYERIE